MIPERYYTYIVRTARGNFYTGISTDPVRRIQEHNESDSKGAKCLRGQRPVSLIWNASFPMTHSEALTLEVLIKKLSRERKEMFLEEAMKLPKTVTLRELAVRLLGAC